jgi:aminoglycoside phosphotransferase (APT) family kinase protein
LTAADPWEAEVAVDASIARAAIARQFPKLVLHSVEPFGEGWDNAAFLVDGAYVFRFPRRRIAVELIVKEMRLLPALAPQLPLPVPLPSFEGRSSADFPWPFAGYARLPGKALTEAGLAADASVPLAVACGAFLRALHAVDPATLPALPGDTIGRFDHARSMPKLRRRLDELSAARLIGDPAPVLESMERIAPCGVRAERACVVHGDLYARHVLIDENGGATGIIDWGDAHFGDPAVDLAIAFSIFTNGARDAFAQAYGGIDARTWELARYRAAYHSAMLAHYGHRIGDARITDAGLAGLARSI